jgi:hypothetical protein
VYAIAQLIAHGAAPVKVQAVTNKHIVSLEEHMKEKDPENMPKR